MIKDKDDCMDLPAERSDNWEINLMIDNWIYDSLFNSVNSLVYVNAIGGDFVLFNNPYKYLPPCILCSSFLDSKAKYTAINSYADSKIDMLKIVG